MPSIPIFPAIGSITKLSYATINRRPIRGKRSPPLKKSSILDWCFSPHDHVQISPDAITLRCDGTFNSDVANITRNYVLSPGKYLLTVDRESERITTNEGPFVPMFPRSGRHDISSDRPPGVGGPPSVGFAPVTIIRCPSQKFNTKIQGTLIAYTIGIERQ